MAELINVGQKNINRYENGSIQDKSIDLLIRILNIFGPHLINKVKSLKVTNDTVNELFFEKHF